jgi:serine/threonine protein phosphatase PrpC
VALQIIEAAGRTDVGRQRETNEDAFLESSPVFCVADGMGGARAGEVAARTAIETLAGESDSSTGAETLLAETARSANRRIHELAQADESLAGMGTTFTAVLVEDGDVVTGHVGDSRLYRLRDGGLERLTRDHSLVEELVRRGELQPEEAEVHPQRSIITRALGPEPEVEVETFTAPGRGGDVYLLCSDGLTAMVSEERVAEIMRETAALEETADKLVAAANEAGGKDNITVVLFRLEEDRAVVSAAPADTLGGQDTRADLSATEVRGAVAEKEDDTAVRPPAARREPTSRRRRVRRWLAGGVALLAIVAVAAGLYLGSREVYFVGTNESGLVTLYRGLPYDLPLGIELYGEEYVSEVPAASIEPPDRREAIIDQRLRDEEEAVDAVRELEQGDGSHEPSRPDPAGREVRRGGP